MRFSLVLSLVAEAIVAIALSDPHGNTLTSCLSTAKIPISPPSSPNFTQLAAPYNLRLQYTPAVIVLPKTSQHISDAILCATRFGVKVQAKSGGHSYASFSSGGQNGNVVISLEAFQDVVVDSAGVVKVGGGVRLGNLALGLFKQGGRALPHGVCPGVGIGGHATHGGYWFSSRNWGLTLDTIIGLDVVLANGSHVHATNSSYPDTYWALRGAADSFGIISTFYFQTQPAPPWVVNWRYTFSNQLVAASTAAATFSHIQEFAQNTSVMTKSIGFSVSSNGLSLTIIGTYIGSQSDFTNIIAPELLRGLPTPSSTSIKTLDWISSLTDLWGGSLQEPVTGYNAHDTFYAKSVLVPESSPLTQAAIESYFSCILTNAMHFPGLWFFEISLVGGPGSLVNSPPTAARNSAYSERGALWVVQHYASGSSPEIIPFVDGLNNAMEKEMAGTNFGGYVNYVDSELSASEAHALYYSKDVYSRLARVKKALDPENVLKSTRCGNVIND